MAGKFGEPWESDIAEQLADCPPTYRIFASDGGTYEEGDFIAETASRKIDARIIACVNALAGVEDPEAFVQAARDYRKAFAWLQCVPITPPYSESARDLPKQRIVEALARLRSMLPEEEG